MGTGLYRNMNSTRAGILWAIAAVIVVFALWECMLGWGQLAGFIRSRHSLYSATGTFFNPGPFCGFLGVVAPLAVHMVLVPRMPRVLRWLGAVYLVGSLSLMPSLMGRTGWLACVAGCGYVLVACGRVKVPRGAMAAVVSVVMVVAAMFLYWLKPASALGRLFLWRIGASAMLDSPLTGVGWENVSGALGAAQEAYFAGHAGSAFGAVAGTPEYAFNEFLQIGIAFGIPAMLLFMIAVVLCFRFTSRCGCYGVAGAWVAFAVTCMSSYPLQFQEFMVVMALMGVAAAVCIPAKGWIVQVACSVATVVLTVVCIGHVRTVERCKDDWKSVSHVYRYRQLTERDVARLDSLAAGPHGAVASFLFDYGMALRRSARYDDSNRVLSRGVEVSADPMFLNILGRNCQDMALWDEAECYYRRSADRLPGRLYPWYLLAVMHAGRGDTVRFREVYRFAAGMEPKVMSPAIRQMREQLKHKNDSLMR